MHAKCIHNTKITVNITHEVKNTKCMHTNVCIITN